MVSLQRGVSVLSAEKFDPEDVLFALQEWHQIREDLQNELATLESSKIALDERMKDIRSRIKQVSQLITTAGSCIK